MKLTKDKLEMLEKLQLKFKKVSVTVGGEQYDFNVAQRFSNEKLKKINEEFIESLIIKNEEENSIKGYSHIVVIYGLILKHLTDASFYSRRDSFTSQDLQDVIDSTNSLSSIYIDNKSLFMILVEAFEQEELNKVFASITDLSIQMSKFKETTKASVDLMLELVNFISKKTEEAELLQKVIERIEYLGDGGNREFEKDEDTILLSSPDRTGGEDYGE